MSRDAEELCTRVPLTTKGVEPVGTTSANRGCYGDGLDVGDGSRASEETDCGGERGLETGLSRLALERLDERSLLTTDVGTHATVDVNVEVVTRTAGVLANETLLVSLLNGPLEDSGLVVELAADVDVGGCAVHGTTGNKTSFNQLVRVFSHNLTVLAGAWLALVGVDDEIAGLGVLVPVLGIHKRLDHG